jgi:hypothetical protein
MKLTAAREFLALLSAGARMVPLGDNGDVWRSLAGELVRIRANPHAAAEGPAGYSASCEPRHVPAPSSRH